VTPAVVDALADADGVFFDEAPGSPRSTARPVEAAAMNLVHYLASLGAGP